MAKQPKILSLIIALTFVMFFAVGATSYASKLGRGTETVWSNLGINRSGTVTTAFTTEPGSPVVSVQMGGNDVGAAIALDMDFHVYVAGNTNSLQFGSTTVSTAGGNDYFVTKYSHAQVGTGTNLSTGIDLVNVNNSAFDTSDPGTWTTLLGSANDDIVTDIALAKVGTDAVYVVGYTNGGLPKGDDGTSFTNAGGYDMFLTKIDSFGTSSTTGTSTFTRQIGTIGDDKAFGVALDITVNEDIYIAGETSSGTGTQLYEGQTKTGVVDAFLTKYNSDGTTRWSILKGEAGKTTSGRAIAVDSNEIAYIAGFTDGSLDGSNSGGFDIFVMKVDKSDNDDDAGTILWTKLFGTTADDRATGIAVVEDADVGDAVYVTGYTNGALGSQTNNGGYDAFVMRIDSSGTHKWTKLIGTAVDDKGTAIDVSDASNKVFITGYTSGSIFADGDGATTSISNNGGADIFVAQVATTVSAGTWEKTQVLGSAGQDIGTGIAVKPWSSMCFVTGYSDRNPTDDSSDPASLDIVDWKLSQFTDMAISSDASFNFGNVAIGSSSTNSYTLTNITSSTIDIGAFSSNDANGDFTFLNNTCDSLSSMPASTGCTFDIKFTPSSTADASALPVTVTIPTTSGGLTNNQLILRGKGVSEVIASTDRASMTTPAPGATLDGSLVLFKWQAPTNATAALYWLYVGTTLDGNDIHSQQELDSTLETNVSGIPTAGAAVYVKLWTLVGSSWVFENYQYTAFNTGSPVSDPAIVTPVALATLSGTSQTFDWTSSPGSGIVQYWLYVGDTAAASFNIYSKGTTGTFAAVTGLPTTGTIYVRLWFRRSSGGWQFVDTTYTGGP